MNSVETNVSNYTVPSDTMNQFQNITTFVKNATLKNCKLSEANETDISKWFGDMLVKYCETGLTESDTCNLLSFVRDYNNYLEKKKNDISEKSYIMKTNALTKVGDSQKYDTTKKYYLKKEYSNAASSAYINRYKKVDTYDEDKTLYIKDYEGQYFEVLNSGFIENITYFTFSENRYTPVNNDEAYSEDTRYFIIKKVTNPIKGNISKYCVKNESSDDSNISYTAQTLISKFATNIDYYIAIRIPHLNESNINYYEKEDNTYELVESNNPNEKYVFNSITERDTFYTFNIEYNEAESFNPNEIYYIKNSDGTYTKTEINEFDEGITYYLRTENIFPRSVSKEPTLNFSDTNVYYAQKLSSFHYIDSIASKADYDNFIEKKPLFKVSTTHSANFKDSSFCIYYTVSDDKNYYVPNFKSEIGELSEVTYDITFTKETSFTKDTKYYEEVEYVKVDIPNIEEYVYYTNEETKLKDKMYNYTFSYYPDIYALTKNYFLESTDSLETKETNIRDIVEKIYDEKDKIQIGVKVSSDSSVKPKYVASGSELSQIQKGESNIFFILTVNTTNADLKSLLNELGNNTTNNTALLASTTDVDGDVALTANIYILYKELNPYYREILSSDMIELVDGTYKEDGDLFEGSHLLELVRNENTIQTAMMYPRSVDTSFLVKDIYTVESGKSIVSETTQTFKYLRGNPYLARKSSESDIIAYYYGDNYISNGYGRYKYEIREIENFLTIFKETRDFYYQVLLNYSFINEEAYQLYEKMFISFWSIERFLSSKIESVKDIDSYSLTDCENFFKSFGFEELGNKINLKEYYDCEEYAKAIIKNYVKLVQNKGNKQVISDLETILSVNNTSLNIYKHTINKVRSEEYTEITDDDPSNIEKYIFNETTQAYEKFTGITSVDRKYYKSVPKTSYLVSKTNFANNNITESLLTTSTEKKDLVDITSADIYWNASHDTPTEILNDLSLSSASTKYISAELIAEMSEYYFTTRVIFAIIDWLFSLKSTETENFSDIKYSPDGLVEGSIPTLGEYITAVKQLYSAYYSSAISNGITTNFKTNSEKEGYSLRITQCTDIEKYYSDYNVDTSKIHEFYSDISTSQMNIINQILNDAQPLRFNSISGISEYIYAKKNNRESIALEDVVLYVVKPILNLFKIYLNNGIITIDNIYIPFDGGVTDINRAQEGDLETYSIIKLLYDIIGHFYIKTSENNNMMYEKIGSVNYQTIFNLSNSESTLSLKNKLLEVANDLTEVLDTVISFGITQSTESISFLKTTIDYFISYTTEILSFTYAKAWNSTSEAASISEDYKFRIESIQTENFFFDDKLTIEVKDEEVTNENRD